MTQNCKMLCLFFEYTESEIMQKQQKLFLIFLLPFPLIYRIRWLKITQNWKKFHFRIIETHQNNTKLWLFSHPCALKIQSNTKIAEFLIFSSVGRTRSKAEVIKFIWHFTLIFWACETSLLFFLAINFFFISDLSTMKLYTYFFEYTEFEKKREIAKFLHFSPQLCMTWKKCRNCLSFCFFLEFSHNLQ